MKNSLRAIGKTLVLFLCLLAWAVIAMDYGDHVVVGTYFFRQDGESSTLTLSPDHTFHQLWLHGSDERHADGTWRRVGEGGVSFSKNFLVVAGDEPEPDGTTFSDMEKLLGLYPSLRLRQHHVLWYRKTSAEKSPVGTYKGDEPDVTSTLQLNEDYSFVQTLTREGVSRQVSGKWSQDSKGTIQFSNHFLKTSGAPLSVDETASSMDPQGSNLQIEISLSDHLPEPVFHKRLLAW